VIDTTHLAAWMGRSEAPRLENRIGLSRLEVSTSRERAMW